MNHPSPESWITFLYDEAGPAERNDLEAHLHVCTQCRGQVDQVRKTMGLLDLDTATLAVPRREVGFGRTWRPRVAWAAAAAVLLCAGFLAGRAGRVSRGQLREELAAVESRIRDETRERHARDLETIAAATVAATTRQNEKSLRALRDEFVEARARDQRQLLTVLDRMELQRVQDYRSLSGGLVRLARETGNGFRQAEDQFNTIASLDSNPVSPAISNENKP